MLIHCIWDDEAPPAFLWDYQTELEKCSDEDNIHVPVDSMSWVIFDFATLRAQIQYKQISDVQAAEKAADLERRIIEWTIETPEKDKRWKYEDMEVEDSAHVWGSMVHSYWGLPAPQAWNTVRLIRIMLTRTQEMLCRRLSFSEDDREEQMQYFRKTRRILTDEICATIPASLGHASPAFNSPCVLISAYSAIWPLFMAGTCALERVGSGAYFILRNEYVPASQTSNRAAAQAQWIMSRLEYISNEVGLKWADGILAILRGDFKAPEHLIEQYVSSSITIRQHVLKDIS